MSRLVKSPTKSPKKLDIILSPRKLPHELRTGSGLLQGVKRKAVSPENSPGSSKKKCLRDSVVDENSRSAKKVPTSPAAGGSQNRILAPIDNSASPAGQAKSAASRKLFMSTPTKSKNNGSGDSAAFQSPTADLPNYVFNPQPRTPRASAKKHTDADKEKTPNWLTRMRLQKLRAEKLNEDEKLGQSPGGSDSGAKQTSDGGNTSSHETEVTSQTPSSSHKTPRQVKRVSSSNKSAKKRVSFGQTYFFDKFQQLIHAILVFFENFVLFFIFQTPRSMPTRRSIENYFSPK